MSDGSKRFPANRVSARVTRAWLACVTFTGCYGVAPPPQPVSSEMHLHLALAQMAMQSAVLADFPALREAARELSDRGGVEGVPASSRQHLVELRLTAGVIAGDTDLGVAIRRTASLAANCGACHTETGANPFPAPNDDPPGVQAGHAEGATTVVTRLWEGVAGPTESLWAAGASALPTAPLPPGDALSRDRTEAARARFQSLGWEAASATLTNERIAALADVITACAGCHLSQVQ